MFITAFSFYNSQVLEPGDMSSNRGMAKERSLFSLKEGWSYVICRKLGASGDHHIKRIKSISESKCCIFSHFGVLDFNICTDEFKAEAKLSRGKGQLMEEMRGERKGRKAWGQCA